MELFSGSVEDKAQSDGAQTIKLEAKDNSRHHQLQVEVPEVPTAGTMTVAGKTPGASEFVDLDPVIDLTAGNQLYQFDGYYSEVRLTPAGFDAAKTYSVYMVSGRD